MKTRWMHLIAGFTMFALCISVCTTTTNATVIWEDNFNDGVLDGWTIFGYESVDNYTKTEGNFSAASGMLEVLDDDINDARYNSTVSVGTWSFDMFVPEDDSGEFYLEFMSNGWDHNQHPNSSVACIGAWLTEGKFMAWCLIGAGYHVHKNIYVDTFQGWHHIEVSRNSDGRILIYFNGTLEADYVCPTVTSSTYLQLWCRSASGAAIDNLVVDDEYIDDHTTTTTTTTTTTGGDGEIDWTLIAIGGGFAAVVIVVAVVFLRRR